MAIPFGCVGAVGDNFARIADDDAIARHIEIDVCVGRDEHIVANGNPTDHDGVRAYPNFIAYRRRAFALAAVFPSDSYARSYVAVTANFCLCVDNDRAVVPYEKPFAYLRLCGDMKGIFFIQNLEPVSVIQIQQLVML